MCSLSLVSPTIAVHSHLGGEKQRRLRAPVNKEKILTVLTGVASLNAHTMQWYGCGNLLARYTLEITEFP